MSEMTCGNCGGTWVNNVCLDCGATLAMIAAASERPDGPAALLLNMLRHALAERGGLTIHPIPEESDDDE